MQNEPQFSNLIYEYFLMRFRFRYYQYGDLLPSNDALSQAFNVSPQTVRAALRRLRAEGYLSMHSGQSTKVVFQQTEGDRAAFILRFYAERWDAFQDLYASAEVMFVPLLVEGLRRMDEQDLAYLARLAARGGADDLFYFYCDTLRKLENPLALNLFWEITSFQGFPFARREADAFQFDDALVRRRLERLIAHVRARDWPAVQRALLTYQRSDVDRMMKALSPYLGRLDVEQIPFVWRIYRGRPQLCYDLASQILDEIYQGRYREAEVLPSYGELAKTYGVSFSTVRRTVEMLNQIGAVRSGQGTNTRVFGMGKPCGKPNLEDPGVRRNLSCFLQSYELLIYSCEGVTRSLIAHLTAAEREALAGRYDTYLAAGQCERSLWAYLRCVVRGSPLAAIREIYRNIYDLFLWGYPLKAACGGTPALDQALVRFTASMPQALRAGDAEACAGTVKALIGELFPAAERFLSSLGLEPDRLRQFPHIRLALPES